MSNHCHCWSLSLTAADAYSAASGVPVVCDRGVESLKSWQTAGLRDEFEVLREYTSNRVVSLKEYILMLNLDRLLAVLLRSGAKHDEALSRH
jgi:hypothetical protein